MLIPLVSLIIISFYFFSNELFRYPKELQQSLEYLATPFFMLLSFVMLIFTIISSHDKMLANREIDLAHNTISSAHSYYSKLASLSEDIRRRRHDNRFHILAVKKLLLNGNTEEALQYLDKKALHDDAVHITEYCVSPVINALISGVEEICVSKKIIFTPQLSLPREDIIDEYELCAILGNLLENAVTACERTPENQKKFINLVMRPNADRYGIMVENSYDGYLHKEGENFLSTKTSGGGLGISSIKAIAKQHGGEYVADYDEKNFKAYVVIK